MPSETGNVRYAAGCEGPLQTHSGHPEPAVPEPRSALRRRFGTSAPGEDPPDLRHLNRPRRLREQSVGEFPSADPLPRTPAAELQLPRLSLEFPHHPRSDLQHGRHTATSDLQTTVRLSGPKRRPLGRPLLIDFRQDRAAFGLARLTCHHPDQSLERCRSIRSRLNLSFTRRSMRFGSRAEILKHRSCWVIRRSSSDSA